MAVSYTVVGTAVSSTTPDDPSLCRVTGYLKDIHGNAIRGREITVRNIYTPAAVGSSTLILQEHQQVRSDSTGKVQFDLYQGATVRIEMPGRLSEIVKEVVVPEAASIDLIGLIFPYLESVTFDEDTYAAVVEEQFTIGFTGLLSNGEEASASLASALTWEISDEDVLERVGGGTFRALSAGTATVTISDVDFESMDEYVEPDGDVISFIDHPTITYDTITITVS